MQHYHELDLPLVRIGGRPPLLYYTSRLESTDLIHTITLEKNGRKTKRFPDDFRYSYHCPKTTLSCTSWVDCRECSCRELEYLDQMYQRKYGLVGVHGSVHRRFPEGWLVGGSCGLEFAGPGSLEIDYIWESYGVGTYEIELSTLDDGSWIPKLLNKF